MIEVRTMDNSEISRIAEIDRSERVTLRYTLADGQLVPHAVDRVIENWSVGSTGHHSVDGMLGQLMLLLEAGGVLLGAFDGDTLAGMVIMRPRLTDTRAQLAGMYVSRPYRRCGVGSMLVSRVAELAKESGAKELYISSLPTGPTVEFYIRQGFMVTADPDPDLFALEPHDIHMTKIL